MQLNSVYLYPNKIDVFTNALASWQTERYRRVYNRNLKIYRSVDNRIDVQVRNSDQKATSINGSTLVFNIITREGNDLVMSKDCTTVSQGSGMAYVTLTQMDMRKLESGFYNYSITQEIRDPIAGTDEYRITSRTPMFQDSQYGTVGTLEVNGDVLGEGEQSLVITKFDYNNPATTGYKDPKYFTSSIIDTIGNTQVPESLHTFQIYCTNYTGTIRIQGSLSEGGTPSKWVTLEAIPCTNASIVYQNIVGKYNFFRVRHYPSTVSAVAKFVIAQTTLGTYTVDIDDGGRGYKTGDVITITGDNLGGATTANDLTITVTRIDETGRILEFSKSGTSYIGVRTFVVDGNLPDIGSVDKILYR